MDDKSFTRIVYLLVCDISLTIFKEANKNSSYVAYCKNVKLMLDRNYTPTIASDLINIGNDLSKILGLSENEAIAFIIKFFQEEKYNTYYRAIKDIKDVYGSFIKIIKK